MPDFKNIEIPDGREGVPSAKGRTIKSTPTPTRQEPEVVGHYRGTHWSCYQCGSILWMAVDHDDMVECFCQNCGALNRR